MRVSIDYMLVNVNAIGRRAIYRIQDVSKIYNTAKEAGKDYNLRMCKYSYVDDDDNIIKTYNNAKLDGFGRRIN